MSENLDLVRSIYAEWERGDYGSTEWAHRNIGFEKVGETPDAGAWKGLAGMAQGFSDFLRPWQELRVEADEYRELDSEHVLVFNSVGGRGKASGLQVSHAGATLFRVCEGKVARLVLYWDRDCALADLGLKE
jgi:ketosteroid isomerase-like protein